MSFVRSSDPAPCARALTLCCPVFDKRYFDAIGAPDAWHIIAEEDFDADESSSGTRPTHSALRVKELAEQLAGELSDGRVCST